MAEYIFEGADIWKKLIADCAAAQESIELEQYILLDDAIGLRFLTLLRDKAREGIRIRMLLDWMGCRPLTGHPLIDDIRRHGGQVKFYNRMRWHNALFVNRWLPRNHAKTCMIDGRLFHIGSACMGDYMADWHEAHLRLDDEHIDGIEKDFFYHASSQAPRARLFEYLRSRPGRRSPIYREMLARIRQARESVFFVTPYFMPPILLQRALRKASDRGVDVRILIAGNPDVPLALTVGQTYFKRIRRHGARVFLYGPKVLHAKYMVVDDNWAMMGSANLDYLSLLHNREANLLVHDQDVAHVLVRRFKEDCNASREVDDGHWKSVPLSDKVIGYLGRAIKKLL